MTLSVSPWEQPMPTAHPCGPVPGKCTKSRGKYTHLNTLRETRGNRAVGEIFFSPPLHLMYSFASVLTRPRLKFLLTVWLPPALISVILFYGRPRSRLLGGCDAL